MSEVILSIKNLSKSFGKRKAVDDLSFDIKEGRNSALQDVGALVERPDFYEYLSAYKNLSLLATMDEVPKKRIYEVLESVGLSNRSEDKVKAYSQGMKQRLGFAQALLSNPKLLILDEPTNGLDPRGMKEVRDLIRKLAQEGIAILLSSHLLHEVEQVCTTMAIINLGKLIKIGSVHDLLNESDTFITEIKAEPVAKAMKVLKSLTYISSIINSDGIFKVKTATKDLKNLTRTLVEAGVDVSAIIPRTSLE
jgi:ABC-2 type transport system ATP-binding protein